MKVQSIKNTIAYPQTSLAIAKRDNEITSLNTNFKGNLSKPSPITDKILKNKVVKSLFELADKNPFAFNTLALASTCMVMRPATIMVVPGSNDKDKKYAAAKSFTASFISTASRLIFILPLGIAIKKLGERAKTNPEIDFPQRGTPKFNAFNFAVNNTTGALLAIPIAALVVYLVAKIMDKIMHNSNNKSDKKDNIQNISELNNVQEGKPHEN